MSPNTPPPSTRERIIAHLRENRTATVSALSRAWGLTRADIRYHLNALIEEGLVERAPASTADGSTAADKVPAAGAVSGAGASSLPGSGSIRAETGSGAAGTVNSAAGTGSSAGSSADSSGTAPAGRGRPTQHYRLAARSAPDNYPILCSALVEALLGALPDAEKESALRALAEQLSRGFTPPAPLTQRFNQAAAFLNELSYHARWEASARGPRILLRNCPYAAILSRHPELCTLDRFLLERLLQSPLRQSARMNLLTGKPPACVFNT